MIMYKIAIFCLGCYYHIKSYLLECAFYTHQSQWLLFVEINCYFYINTEAVPNLQRSLIALEFFTALPLIQGLDFIFMLEFCCAILVAFCHGHYLPLLLISLFLILFLLDLISCCSWHLLQPDKLTAPIVNLAPMLSFPQDGK